LPALSALSGNAASAAFAPAAPGSRRSTVSSRTTGADTDRPVPAPTTQTTQTTDPGRSAAETYASAKTGPAIVASRSIDPWAALETGQTGETNPAGSAWRPIRAGQAWPAIASVLPVRSVEDCVLSAAITRSARRPSLAPA
jgi:hypothetical protein